MGDESVGERVGRGPCFKLAIEGARERRAGLLGNVGPLRLGGREVGSAFPRNAGEVVV